MTTENINKVNQWTVDFAQAKIGLKNIEILVHNITQDQLSVASNLQSVFKAYEKVLDEDEVQVAIDRKHIESIKSQLLIFNDVEKSLHSSVVKFVGKCEAQLDLARGRLQAVSQSLNKLRSMKEPQHTEHVDTLMKEVPAFLTVFDSFLRSFTLRLRWQQASFYKELGESFTSVTHPESIDKIKLDWWKEFQQIAQAVEALKSVHVRDGRKPIGSIGETGNKESESLEGDSGSLPIPEVQTQTVKTDNVLMNSVKWINSKVGKDVKTFKFSDPRSGFFEKSTVPPEHKSETVVAAFDFEGETESDLPFKKGAVITIVDKGTEDDPNWWCGEINGKRGLFPKNYIVTESPEKETHPDEYIPEVPLKSNEKTIVSETPGPSSTSANESKSLGTSTAESAKNDISSDKHSAGISTVEKAKSEISTDSANVVSASTSGSKNVPIPSEKLESLDLFADEPEMDHVWSKPLEADAVHAEKTDILSSEKTQSEKSATEKPLNLKNSSSSNEEPSNKPVSLSTGNGTSDDFGEFIDAKDSHKASDAPVIDQKLPHENSTKNYHSITSSEKESVDKVVEKKPDESTSSTNVKSEKLSDSSVPKVEEKPLYVPTTIDDKKLDNTGASTNVKSEPLTNDSALGKDEKNTTTAATTATTATAATTTATTASTTATTTASTATTATAIGSSAPVDDEDEIL